MCFGPKGTKGFDRILDQFFGLLAVVLILAGFVVAMMTLYPLGKLQDWWRKRN